MKKVILFLFLFFISFSIKAQTALNDYYVDVTFNENKEFEVKENFHVSSSDNVTFKREISKFCYDIETNLDNYSIEENDNFKIISFRLNSDKDYYFNYKENYYQDVNEYRYYTYAFYNMDSENDYIINGLVIKFDSKIDYESLSPIIDSVLFNESVDGSTHIWHSIYEPKYVDFMFNIGVEKEFNIVEVIENMNIGLTVSLSMFIIIIVSTILVFVLGFDRKVLAITLTILVVISFYASYLLSNDYPVMIVFSFFYALFYYVLWTIKNKDEKVKLFVVAFLAFHSYFFFGLPNIYMHVLNNINIYLASELYACYAYKGKKSEFKTKINDRKV